VSDHLRNATISTSERQEFLEALIDDEMDLPERAPADPIYFSQRDAGRIFYEKEPR